MSCQKQKSKTSQTIGEKRAIIVVSVRVATSEDSFQKPVKEGKVCSQLPHVRDRMATPTDAAVLEYSSVPFHDS